MESSVAQAQELIRNTIETEKESLFSLISQPLWKNPEIAFEEVFAHKLITEYLEKRGFKVYRKYHLPTAFRAEYGNLTDAKFTLCIICEYDALPEIGHACGHNLISAAGVGAAVAIKAAINLDEVKGKLVVMGTPAEEGGGGKSILIEAGAFKDIDAAMMVHPGPYDVIEPVLLAVERLTIQYFGRPAHASLAPWEGTNALDAAVLCYTSIGLLRQHMRPNCKAHGIITKGGTKPNIVPAETELVYYIRAANKKNLDALKTAVTHCIESAATATGCQTKYRIERHGYDSFRYIKSLQDTYKQFAQQFGVKYDERYWNTFTGSTDMGNVSQIVPSIHPVFSIKTNSSNHTKEFAAAAGSAEAQAPTIIAATCMALTALQIFTTPSFQNELIELKNNPENPK